MFVIADSPIRKSSAKFDICPRAAAAFISHGDVECEHSLRRKPKSSRQRSEIWGAAAAVKAFIIEQQGQGMRDSPSGARSSNI